MPGGQDDAAVLRQCGDVVATTKLRWCSVWSSRESGWLDGVWMKRVVIGLSASVLPDRARWCYVAAVMVEQ